MSRCQRHSKEFKDAIIKKIVNRGDSSFIEVCATSGISSSTAYNWLKHATIPGMKTNKIKLKKWTAKEKLKAVTETLSTNEVETGFYLRKEM